MISYAGTIARGLLAGMLSLGLASPTHAEVPSASQSITGCEARFDGDCWLSMEKATGAGAGYAQLFKISWAAGLLGGLHLAPFVIAQGWTDDPSDRANETEWNRRLAQMETVLRKYSPGLKSSQIVDGLDAFYKDYANRRIEWFDAAWVVLRRIAGDAEADVDALVLKLRQSVKP